MVLKMKFRLIAAVAFAFLALASCKKEETTKVYMDGALTIKGEIPKYVTPGSTYTFSASGVTAPDGTAVGYYFRDPVTKTNDTTQVFTYTVPDSLGRFSITCAAYPVKSSDKYYSSTTAITFTVVSEDRSLTGIPEYPGDGSATLYSRSYPTFKVGQTEWTGANLSFMAEGFGAPYDDSPALQNILGVFYTWDEAQTACPDGWHLPSEEEWLQLLKSAGAPQSLEPFQDSPSGAGNLMVKARFNEEEFWEYYRGVDVRNATHFSAISAGYANIASGSNSFYGFGSYAAFWTSDELDGKGVYRYIYQEFDNVYTGLGDKGAFAASVRCVR